MKKTIKKSDVSAFCFRERKGLFSATEKGKVSSPLQRKEGLFSATEKGKGSSLLPRKERALLRYRERKRHFSALQRKEAALLRFRERKRSFSSFEKGSGAFPLQRKQHFSVSFYRQEEYFSKIFSSMTEYSILYDYFPSEPPLSRLLPMHHFNFESGNTVEQRII